jgi:tRNA (cytidine/uridine-2'-O-)-methyltransferase
MRLALYQPDIPQNVGSLIRLAACFGLPLEIVEPCGFAFDERRIRRVAMDYREQAQMTRHPSWEAFLQAVRQPPARLLLLTTKGERSLYEAAFQPDDILLLGRESGGVPPQVAQACDLRLRIPLAAGVRSLNIAQAASVAAGEAMRQMSIRDSGK